MPYEFILSKYGIINAQVNDRGKIKKIITPEQTFALKETEITAAQAEQSIHALRKLIKLDYTHFVPIIRTIGGEYYVRVGRFTYYLMPWMHDAPYTAEQSKEQKLIEELSLLHRLTIETSTFTAEQWTDHFASYKRRWGEESHILAQFIHEAERAAYISPFQFAILMHAHSFEQMREKSLMHLDESFAQSIEKEKIRIALCHQRVMRSHAFFTEQQEPILFNFEQAALMPITYDLIHFFRHNVNEAKWSFDEVYRWLLQYEQKLPLLEEEKYLLSALLNDFSPIIELIEMYMKDEYQLAELHYVEQFERELMNVRQLTRLADALFSMSNEAN